MNATRPVDQVHDGLYISGMRAVYHAETLRAMGISRVLKLYFGKADTPRWPADFLVLDNAIEDGMPLPAAYLRQGVDFIHAGRSQGTGVLVSCWAGISRSSTFVLAYLVESGYDLRAAWQLLVTSHPRAWPAFELWKTLLLYYDLPYTMDEVMTWLDWEQSSATE